MTTAIRYDDLVESVAAALQYISYYHPTDYISHLARAYQREESDAARAALAPAWAARVDELVATTGGAVVAVYLSYGTEPPTSALVDSLVARGARVLVPVLLPDHDLGWADLPYFNPPVEWRSSLPQDIFDYRIWRPDLNLFAARTMAAFSKCSPGSIVTSSAMIVR